jgi:metallo-beta-lactamase family protein
MAFHRIHFLANETPSSKSLNHFIVYPKQSQAMKSNKPISIKFLGGAGTVTGSKTMVEYEGKRVLVDCGLFQGVKTLRELNWQPFSIAPESFDALILTNAHLDHCGYIPVFVKNGFSGNIHCTHPTKDLTEIILKDSAKIQEEEAERANRLQYTRHKPAKPLYTVSEAIASLSQIISHDFHEWIIINEHMKFRFLNSGHILGSAMVALKVADKTIFFSGDIGRQDPILLPPRELASAPDVIVMESTYGDRLHETTDPAEQLAEVIEHT